MLQKELRKTSSQLIYESIKDDIIFLRRKPGEEISIQALSEELDVSRSPVRDALIKLQGEALIEMLPQRGCWVSKIDLKRVEDERHLRLALERSVLESFNKMLKDSEIASLEYYLALQREAIKEKQSEAFYSADDNMHEVYFEAAGYKRFWDLLMKETGNYRRMRLLSFDAEGIAKKNIQQHEELVAALRCGDFTGASRITNEHISKLTIELDAIVGEHPDYFIRG